MDPIPVPKPKGVRDPNRPASSLLLAQIHHLREAEKNLPVRYHSSIFHKSLITEGEVARYVRAVTEAIHQAHNDAVKERVKAAAKRKAPRRQRVIELAAQAEATTERKRRPGKKKARAKARRKS
jgi:hypothetical protein